MAWTTPATFTSGQILTAAQMNTNVRDNTNALYDSVKRLAYDDTATFVNSTASLTGGNDVFDDITFTAAGSTTYRVEVYLPYVATASNGGASLSIYLTDGGNNSISFLGYVGTGTGSYGALNPVYAIYYYTPTSGSKTLNVRATHAVAAGNVGASTGENMQATIAVYGPALT